MLIYERQMLERSLLPLWIWKSGRSGYKCILCGEVFKSRVDAVLHGWIHVKVVVEGANR